MLVIGTVALAFEACSQTPSSTTTPSVSETSAPSAAVQTPAGSATAGVPACTSADVKASHGLVEGAAGSRLTTVVLVASMPCSVGAFPAMGLRDAVGTALVGAPAGGSGRLDLVAGGVYESEVRLANWCAAEPTFPLSLVLSLPAEQVTVTGGSFPDESDLPPCNGGAGPILEAGAWAPSP